MAKKNHHPVSAEVENNPLYHDTYKLLRCYRDSTYSLMVAVRQVEIQFQLEYNTSVDEFLDSIYAAGADLGDSQIEEWAKSIARSNKMIKLLLSSVDLLRKNHKHGEEYYWILYYAFLSPHELKNTEEILEELEKHVPSISYRTYYRRRQAAINALSSILYNLENSSIKPLFPCANPANTSGTTSDFQPTFPFSVIIFSINCSAICIAFCR